MTSIPVSIARKHFYQLVDEVARSHVPVSIIGRRNAAVLINRDDWRAIEETLHLLAVPGMRESIVTGLKTPIRQCRKRLSW